MGSVKLVGNQLSDDEIEKFKSLAIDAGCVEGDVQIVKSIGEPDPECADEIVLVLLTAAVCEDAGLEENLAKVQNGGRRAICVWAENGSPAEPPPGAQKYSYSVVPWNPNKLKAAMADDDVTCFETASGEVLPSIPVDRNQCVDEPAKPK